MTKLNRNLAMLLVLDLTGCIVAEGEVGVADQSQSIINENAMSSNALSSNALSSNALSSNALSSNAMTAGALTVNRFLLNTEASLEMELTEDGRQLLRYMAKCALEEGENLVFKVDEVVYEYPGYLGIAPDWKYQALSLSERHAVSACLLAHVNHFGVSVIISVRRHGLDDVTDEELIRFPQYEGTFYGDIFSLAQPMYACMGDPAPDFSVEYPNHDTSHGDRLLRRCTDLSSDSASQTECDFMYVGSCSDVCDTTIGDSHSDCRTDKSDTGTTYGETMSVWLLAYDDPESVWEGHYDEFYGP